MDISRWSILRAVNVAPDPDQERFRIRILEREIGLPVKAIVIVVLFYYLFFSHWFEEVANIRDAAVFTVRLFFLVYVGVNTAIAMMLIGMDQLRLQLIRVVVLASAFIDGLFAAALTVVAGGFDSILFWLFLGLTVRNAISIPATVSQIAINLLVTGFYVLAGFADLRLINDPPEESDSPEPLFLRVVMLVLMTACCYGVQLLLDKQRRVDQEAHEFALRQEQLRVSGRLAAEIAHQLKNPLGIINNAAFNLQRNVKEGKATITQQIRIIREEVERSDRIITDLMGYAKLADGTVERLNVAEELDKAISQVFPPAASFDIQVHHAYYSNLPPLLMQRNHLSEIFVNVLQNAREAMSGHGNVHISAQVGDDSTVVVAIADNGPGIANGIRERIFDPYFTTKTKGSGLGLAIVKQNTEMYGGTIRVESEPGKGARFVLQFPAKTLVQLRK